MLPREGHRWTQDTARVALLPHKRSPRRGTDIARWGGGDAIHHLVILALLAFPDAVGGSAAQPADVDANAHRIFSELMSPYCPGLMLADCPSPDAFARRAEIRARLAAGENPARVKEDLYARFGESIRATPEPREWGLLLWAAPLLVLAGSFGGLAWYLAHRHPRVEPDLLPAADRALEHRLDDELESL